MRLAPGRASFEQLIQPDREEQIPCAGEELAQLHTRLRLWTNKSTGVCHSPERMVNRSSSKRLRRRAPSGIPPRRRATAGRPYRPRARAPSRLSRSTSEITLADSVPRPSKSGAGRVSLLYRSLTVAVLDLALSKPSGALRSDPDLRLRTSTLEQRIVPGAIGHRCRTSLTTGTLASSDERGCPLEIPASESSVQATERQRLRGNGRPDGLSPAGLTDARRIHGRCR